MRRRSRWLRLMKSLAEALQSHPPTPLHPSMSSDLLDLLDPLRSLHSHPPMPPHNSPPPASPTSTVPSSPPPSWNASHSPSPRSAASSVQARKGAGAGVGPAGCWRKRTRHSAGPFLGHPPPHHPQSQCCCQSGPQGHSQSQSRFVGISGLVMTTSVRITFIVGQEHTKNSAGGAEHDRLISAPFTGSTIYQISTYTPVSLYLFLAKRCHSYSLFSYCMFYQMAINQQ